MSCRGRLNSLLETWTVPNWMRISLNCLRELVLCNGQDEWTQLGSSGACAQLGCNDGPKELCQMDSPSHDTLFTTPGCIIELLRLINVVIYTKLSQGIPI